MKIKLLKDIDYLGGSLKKDQVCETVKMSGDPRYVYVQINDKVFAGVHLTEFDLVEEDESEDLSAPPAGCLC